MAFLPRIAGTNIAPTGGARFAANSAAANVDPNPLSELDQTNALIYEGRSEFQYDQFDAHQHFNQDHRGSNSGRRRDDRLDGPFERTPPRRFNMSMLENSSESFGAAFDMSKGISPQLSMEPRRYQPVTSLDNIIRTYEVTARVIYNEIPPKGENLSVVL